MCPLSPCLAPRLPTGAAIAVTARPDIDILRGQFVAVLAVRPIEPSDLAPLGLRVAHVVEPRPEEQMIEPVAGRVVAGVADVQPVGDRAVGERPDPAMYEPVRALAP